MMKYIHDLFRITVFVFILYTPLTWFTAIDSLKTIEKIEDERASNALLKSAKEVSDFLDAGRILEICLRLKAQQEALTVAAYYVKSSESECYYPDGMTTLPPIEELGVAKSFLFNDIPLTFIRGKNNQTEWAVSVSTPQKLNFYEHLKTNKLLREALIKDLLSVIYLIFAFIFCAVLILAKSIQNQYRKKGKDPLWLKMINATFGKIQLHDLKILQSATSALVQQKDTLERDKDLLETSLEISILNEIKQNNHNVPYSFFGTVAKVDINGYSKVLATEGMDQSYSMTLFLETFGCELLLRYNGLFEKTIGDEIVVVFKSQNSAMLAAAFSRDLMSEFSNLDFEISGEKRKFTLKSSISSSNLIFSKRPPGYGFHGDALTYTSRLLDVVTIKDRNILSCMKHLAHEIGQIITLPNEVKKFEFKNMAPTEGYLIDQFMTIDHAYSSNVELLTFFRSDSALIYLLKKIQTETDLKSIEFTLAALKNVKVRKASSQLISAWIETLETIQNKCTSKEYLILFARLIMKSSNLIPLEQWTNQCTAALLAIPRDLDGRINASIVDILIEKNLHAIVIEDEASFILASDQSFRTKGNILINQAYAHLDNSVLNKVTLMISSAHHPESFTGIFCACSIILHYQKMNPAELEIHSAYQKLVTLLNKVKTKGFKRSTRLTNILERTLNQIEKNAKVTSFYEHRK